jgi:quercetin dioxygenase-like cupin family protein
MKLMPLTVNFRDERGAITDLIEAEEINAVTLVTFCKGAIRGNHVHKHTVQYNYLLRGSIELVTQIADGQRQSAVLGPGELAVVGEMEQHALRALEDSELLVFTRGPRGGKEYESDTYRLDTPLIVEGEQ